MGGVGDAMQCIITIDTEGDNQWDLSAPKATENIRFIPRFQALCERYGFPPTYLCTYDVVESPHFDAVLLPLHREGRAEIGAHLHPWTTPPESEWDRGALGFAYPSELPLDVFTAKLERLTDLLTRKLGAAPRSYRAGRWGLAAAHVPVLRRLGYVVDCSVTPLQNWVDTGARGPGQDFSEAPVHPYGIAADDVTKPGISGLLEVPVTILHVNGWMRQSPALRAAYRRHRKTLPARVCNRLFDVAPRWFRPFTDMSAERLIEVYETAKRLDLPVVEMMFHSSELMPGGSPHNPTAGDVDRLFARLEAVFARLQGDGVTGSTLTAFARSYSNPNVLQSG
jgi:hypothetical protein